MSEALIGNQTDSSTMQTDSGNQTESVGEATSVETGNQTVTDTQSKDSVDDIIDKYWDDEEVGDESELFGDIEDEGADEAADETESEAADEAEDETELDEADTEETEADAAEEDSFEVNFLGNKLSLSREEVVKQAQRGLNAARIEARHEKLKPLEALLEPIAVMSELAGQPMEEIIRGMAGEDGLLSTVMSQHLADGMDEATARELANAKIKAARSAVETKNIKTAQEAKGRLSSAQAEQIDAFSHLRPDVHQKIMSGEMSLPEEVQAAWAAGASLSEAYLVYEGNQQAEALKQSKKEAKTLKDQVKKLEKDLKTLSKNQENKKRNPTSKKGAGGGAIGDDIASTINSVWK